jgi:hypothetical protein
LGKRDRDVPQQIDRLGQGGLGQLDSSVTREEGAAPAGCGRLGPSAGQRTIGQPVHQASDSVEMAGGEVRVDGVRHPGDLQWIDNAPLAAAGFELAEGPARRPDKES